MEVIGPLVKSSFATRQAPSRPVSLFSEVVLDSITTQDVPEILRIVRENNLPKEWTWPAGEPGTAARVNGRLVAFCILKETIYGIVIEEFWREQTRQGVRGLFALGDWIESTTQRLANTRGKSIAVGGIVRNELKAHQDRLGSRGFVEIAKVLEKVFDPEGAA